jgi:RNA polymerase sigma-70 factor (ECF subfamily)
MTAEHNDHRAWDRSTSRSLLAHAQQDDASAWTRLVGLYAPLVAAWCRRWGVAEQDVLDLLQEVFAAVSKNLNHFRKEQPHDTFRGWLLTIARNKVRDHYRRRTSQPAAVGGTEASLRMAQVLDPQSEPAAADTDDQVAFSDVLRRALESIRGEFQEHTWQAFWGVAVEGRLAADVADELSMQPGAVRVAKSRVLLRLRRELGDVHES